MNPIFHQVQFQVSAARFEQSPEDTGFEVAFAGRSNAGKSSAINTLCQQKNLARTSKTPGRTQLLNFFRLDDERRIVDLPGYGYAKVAEGIKQQWQQELTHYLECRRCLRGLVLLMDIRHPLKEYDQLMLDWAQGIGLPTHILLTKADKLKQGAASKSLLQVKKVIADYPGEVSVQRFSALKRSGLDQLESVLSRWFELPESR